MLTWLDYYVYGARDRLIEALRAGGRPRTERPGTGWKLDHLVHVRGHFRLQPYGPGRQQTMLIWIDPHTRGPEDEPHKVDLDRLPIKRKGRANGNQ